MSRASIWSRANSEQCLGRHVLLVLEACEGGPLLFGELVGEVTPSGYVVGGHVLWDLLLRGVTDRRIPTGIALCADLVIAGQAQRSLVLYRRSIGSLSFIPDNRWQWLC